MELSKQYISDLKSTGNSDISAFLSRANAPEVLFFLENLGFLPKSFDGDLLVPLINHHNANIRFWTIKNLGKIHSDKYLEILYTLAQNDQDTSVRREAVSSIGRLRSYKSIEKLIELLNDYDPKIVSQAIRGLLVFKNDSNVQKELKKLIQHPNEVIQSVIKKEFFSNENKSNGEKIEPLISPDYLKNVVVNGDVLDVLKYVPDESIHLTFTSPPYYNARDYSIYPSYQDYLNFLEVVFKEVHRITKEGRFFILNTSPIIIPRVSRSHSSKRYPIPFDIHPFLIKMGWEFIDDLIWLKPEASVKNRIAGFMQHRKPLAYKPNATTEYLMVYRKQTDKLLDWNMRHYDYKKVQESLVPEGYETSNVWKIDPTFDKIHSAVFPIELCKRVIQYYSYVHDLVFDPFGGSGTVGKTAKKLDRYFFLTEKNPDYFNYMKSHQKQSSFDDKFYSKFFTIEQFKEIIKK